MARAAQDAASNANKQYSGYAQSSLNNANSQLSQENDQVSNLQQNNPYTSKAYLTNQNLLTSGAMNAENTQAKQQLQDQAMRTGTNTASLGNTISSNARAGQRQLDNYNAGTATQNVDKSTELAQRLIGDRAQMAQEQGNLYSTSAGGQGTAEGNLTNLNGQQDQLWGNVIAGASSAAGAALA